MPIAAVKAPDLLGVAKRIEERGANYYVHAVMQTCGRVFRYAIATGKAEHDISADLRGALAPHKVRHFASLTNPRQVGQLLRAIDGYQGDFVTAHALKLAPLVFVRPSELRCAVWPEFDFANAEWRIPAERMKMDEQYIVPLSRQALELFEDLHKVTGNGKYLFPSVRTGSRPMSDNTLNAALRRLGYSREEMTGHGFRSMASTLLNEVGWNRDAIERQLAHGDKDSVRASYNFAEFLPERRNW
jgi:integrase